jgi:hypothetical protein
VRARASRSSGRCVTQCQRFVGIRNEVASRLFPARAQLRECVFRLDAQLQSGRSVSTSFRAATSPT